MACKQINPAQPGCGAAPRDVMYPVTAMIWILLVLPIGMQRNTYMCSDFIYPLICLIQYQHL